MNKITLYHDIGHQNNAEVYNQNSIVCMTYIFPYLDNQNIEHS